MYKNGGCTCIKRGCTPIRSLNQKHLRSRDGATVRRRYPRLDVHTMSWHSIVSASIIDIHHPPLTIFPPLITFPKTPHIAPRRPQCHGLPRHPTTLPACHQILLLPTARRACRRNSHRTHPIPYLQCYFDHSFHENVTNAPPSPSNTSFKISIS